MQTRKTPHMETFLAVQAKITRINYFKVKQEKENLLAKNWQNKLTMAERFGQILT